MLSIAENTFDIAEFCDTNIKMNRCYPCAAIVCFYFVGMPD